MEQVKQPLTLNQAAEAYANMLYPGMGPYHQAAKECFTDGGKWQKEQNQELIRWIEKAVVCLRNGGFDDISEFGKLYVTGQKLIEKYNS